MIYQTWDILSKIKFVNDLILVNNGKKHVNQVIFETSINEILKHYYSNNIR